MRTSALIASVAIAALTGCASVQQYNSFEETTKTSAFVRVHWVDNPSTWCSSYQGKTVLACAYTSSTSTLCTIFAQKPADFNDHTALMQLGHEFLHCLGASHESPDAVFSKKTAPK